MKYLDKSPFLILELLKSFSRKELKAFKQFISSSYFNTDKRVVSLYDALLGKCFNYVDLKENDLRAVYEVVFNEKTTYCTKPQRANLHRKMNLLLQLAKRFLSVEALQNNLPAQTNLLVLQMLDKKQYRLHKQFLKKAQQVSFEDLQGIEFFYYQYILSDCALRYAQITRDLSVYSLIKDTKDKLCIYFLILQLDLYLVELSFSELSSKHQIDTSVYDALQPLLKLEQIKGHPLIGIYQSIIKLLKEKEETVFHRIVEELSLYSNILPPDCLSSFYKTLVNFCVLQLRKGKTTYNAHQLSLYQIMDEKNLLLADNEIHIGSIRNIVNIGCRAKAYSWAVDMLHKYYPHLPSNLADDIKNFNLGTIAYYKKDYQQAIDYLFPLSTINLSYDINRRTIMMKAYYELDADYLETTHTLFRSFEKYIRDHKSLTSKSKTSYKNFIRTLINLYRIKHKATKMSLDGLKQKLEAQKLNSNKSWLLEKVGELE